MEPEIEKIEIQDVITTSEEDPNWGGVRAGRE